MQCLTWAGALWSLAPPPRAAPPPYSVIPATLFLVINVQQRQILTTEHRRTPLQ